MDKDYEKAIAHAQACFDDAKKRGTITGKDEWHDLQQEIFTPLEIAESDLRVAIIGELILSRRKKGLSQRELGKLSGISQSVISSIERGKSIPRTKTLLKLLTSIGKKLTIVPM